jgi:hypothetical protein
MVMISDDSQLEKLAETVPGYKGYSNKADGACSDRVIRSYIHKKLMSVKDACERSIVRLIRNGMEDDVSFFVDSGKKMLEMAVSIKLYSCSQGRLFDYDIVIPEVLEELYSYDVILIDIVKEMDRFIRVNTKDILNGTISEEDLYFMENYFFDDLLPMYDKTVLKRDFVMLETR